MGRGSAAGGALLYGHVEPRATTAVKKFSFRTGATRAELVEMSIDRKCQELGIAIINCKRQRRLRVITCQMELRASAELMEKFSDWWADYNRRARWLNTEDL